MGRSYGFPKVLAFVRKVCEEKNKIRALKKAIKLGAVALSQLIFHSIDCETDLASSCSFTNSIGPLNA